MGALKDGGSHRVHCGGPGLDRGEVNVLNEFNVWTREAGPGNLAISVEGPSKAEIDFKDRGDGSCGVSYKVPESGKLFSLISIEFTVPKLIINSSSSSFYFYQWYLFMEISRKIKTLLSN